MSVASRRRHQAQLQQYLPGCFATEPLTSRPHESIFTRAPPARVWVFSERITFYPKNAEVKGSGTTAYAWFVWDKDAPSGTELKWFKPGYKARYG